LYKALQLVIIKWNSTWV